MKQSSFLVLFFLLLTTLSQASTLSINVSDDSGGYYRPGSWFPIIISVSNQPGGTGRDEPFFGRAIVETASYTSNQGSYEFTREISVPVSSQKRFVLYAKIPDKTATQLKISIRRANNQLVQEIPLSISPLKEQEVMTLLISSDLQRINLPLLRASSANTRKQVIRSPEYLPEHWAGYDAANMVVFPAWPTGSMTSKNISALRDWVSAGGTLVLLGGAETSSYQDEAAKEFLPVSLEGTSIVEFNSDLKRMARISSPTDDSFILSESTPLPGTMMISEGSGGLGDPLPLATVREIGLGKVVFFAADLKTNNKGTQELIYPAWFSITPVVSPLNWDVKFVDVINDKLVYVTGKAARPPSAVLIILICILYTLIVGPVNFFVLSKAQRIQWAWLTVPIIVIVFSGLIYGLGTITKGGKTIAREASIYLGKQNSPDFAMESFLGVLTPDATDLEITATIAEQTVADHDRWFEEDSLFGFSSKIGDTGVISLNDNKPVIETTDSGISVAEWPLSTFGFKRFSVRGVEQLEGALDSTIRYGSSEEEAAIWLSGDLTNNLGVEFSDSALFFGTYGLALGAFAADETRSLSKPETLYSLNNQAKTNWSFLLESALRNADNGETESTDTGINNLNALRMANGIFNQENLSKILPSTKGKLYFVGVTETPELSVNINLEADEGSRSKLFVIELNPRPEGSRFWVPEEFVHVSLHNYERLTTVGGDFSFETGGKKGTELLLDQYTTVFVTELPFYGEGIVANAMINKMSYRNDPKRQVVSSFILPIGSGGNPSPLATQPILNGNSQWMTPFNGRSWIVFSSDVPKDDQGKEIGNLGFGADRATKIEKIGFSVIGSVQ